MTSYPQTPTTFHKNINPNVNVTRANSLFYKIHERSRPQHWFRPDPPKGCRYQMGVSTLQEARPPSSRGVTRGIFSPCQKTSFSLPKYRCSLQSPSPSGSGHTAFCSSCSKTLHWMLASSNWTILLSSNLPNSRFVRSSAHSISSIHFRVSPKSLIEDQAFTTRCWCWWNCHIDAGQWLMTCCFLSG